MANYYGRNRRTIYALGSRLGGGGEGEVYEIAGSPNLVAKIYFNTKFTPTKENPNPRQHLREKIETMLDQPVNPYIGGVLSVAWPQDILLDQQGQFAGYTMPRVNSSYHIFAASRERERIRLYPKYTWKTAILIAYNLSLAVKVVHSTNAVIGDMNPNNIMLDEKGHVTLIDTDSFNITNNRTGKVFKCSVGVPEMLPPELQGKNLADPKNGFTQYTDSFALSIHIFNLLMNNCHPFGCVGMNKSQSSSSNNPVVRNIVKGSCPYVTGSSGSTSPGAPDVMMLPKEIRQLFDRAFRYTATTAVRSATITRRPSAEEWQNALGALYQTHMIECRKRAPSIHLYPSGYAKCPWCDIHNRALPVPNPNSGQSSSTRQSGGTSSGTGNTGSAIRRESWPLWLACILTGVISGPFLAQYLVPLVYTYFEVAITMGTAQIVLALVGCVCGAVIAHYGQESYQKAYNAWPWLLLAMAVPLANVLAVAVTMLAIALVILVVTIIFYAIVTVFVVACLCGMCLDG